MAPLSRRGLLAGIPLLSFAASRRSGASSYRVIREFKNASLAALSPDGSLCCLRRAKTFIRSYQLEGKQVAETSQSSAGALEVMDTHSFRVLRKIVPRSDPFVVEFWGNEVLYFETLAFDRAGNRQRVRVDLQAGAEIERVDDGLRSDIPLVTGFSINAQVRLETPGSSW